MDFFYIPWISVLKPEEESTEETEYTIGSVPELVSTKPKYKLTFFASKGFAEISRLILVYVDEPFIDNRISYSEWKAKEGDCPIRRMPMLEFEGHTIYQSMTIAKFLAKQFGLYGKTVFEETEIDEIIETLTILVTYLRPCIFAFYKSIQPEDVKEYFPENTVKYSTTVVQRYLPFLENYASRKTLHGFLLPSGITVADFAVAICYELIENLFPQIIVPYTNLKGLKDRVNELPELQQYLKSRPKSIF